MWCCACPTQSFLNLTIVLTVRKIRVIVTLSWVWERIIHIYIPCTCFRGCQRNWWCRGFVLMGQICITFVLTTWCCWRCCGGHRRFFGWFLWCRLCSSRTIRTGSKIALAVTSSTFLSCWDLVIHSQNLVRREMRETRSKFHPFDSRVQCKEFYSLVVSSKFKAKTVLTLWFVIVWPVDWREIPKVTRLGHFHSQVMRHETGFRGGNWMAGGEAFCFNIVLVDSFILHCSGTRNWTAKWTVYLELPWLWPSTVSPRVKIFLALTAFMKHDNSLERIFHSLLRHMLLQHLINLTFEPQPQHLCENSCLQNMWWQTVIYAFYLCVCVRAHV